jgi:hypothetical protein
LAQRAGVPRLSLHPHAPYPVPEDPQRVARAAFPQGHISLQVADHLGNISPDAPFAALFPPAVNRQKRRHAWHWPQASSVRQGYPIATPPMPSAAAVIGNPSSGWP